MGLDDGDDTSSRYNIRGINKATTIMRAKIKPMYSDWALTIFTPL